jgi:hypothetical protein
MALSARSPTLSSPHANSTAGASFNFARWSSQHAILALFPMRLATDFPLWVRDAGL